MKWEEVCQAFPEQWILIEAIQAYTNDSSERILDEVAPLKKFSNSIEAMRAYQKLHHEDSPRELYVLHTNRKNPNIIEKKMGRCEKVVKKILIEDGLLLTDIELTFEGESLFLNRILVDPGSGSTIINRSS